MELLIRCYYFRQEQFENSAAGRAARVQVQAEKKQSNNPNKGEPVLKVFWHHILFTHPVQCSLFMMQLG